MVSSTRQRRIITLSRSLSLALAAIAFLHPVVVGAVLTGMSDPQVAANALGQHHPDLALSWLTRAAILCLAVVPALILSAGLLALRPALAQMQTGQAFGRSMFQALRRLATAVLASTVAKILSVPLTSLLLSLHLEQGSLSLAFGLADLQMLVLGAAFWLLAWVMAEGYDLASENAQFV